MSSVIATIVIAFFLILIAIALLGLGWLITGKSHIKAGACGRAPNKSRDESCATDKASCGLCEKKDE
jgi:hypothetical protein